MSFNIKLTNTTPTIMENHIKMGYLPRYFAAKANHMNDEVFEINRRDWEMYYNVKYVTTGHLNWVIKGQLKDREHLLYTGNPTFDGGREPINIPGLLTQNRAAVRFLSRKIPAVKNYLTDYKQFYVGE
jgi:hypothetical protein